VGFLSLADLASLTDLGAVYPGQALVFAELMNVFTHSGSKLRSKGDFFAPVFFIIAIGNLIIYFVLGWFSNTIGQV
jgi:ATP-binding cassette subfamily B (MDR/TAP) protein 1